MANDQRIAGPLIGLCDRVQKKGGKSVNYVKNRQRKIRGSSFGVKMAIFVFCRAILGGTLPRTVWVGNTRKGSLMCESGREFVEANQFQ